MIRRKLLAGAALAAMAGACLFNLYDPLDILGSGNSLVTKAYPVDTDTQYGKVLRSSPHYLTLATKDGQGILECYFRDEGPENAKIFMRDENKKADFEKGRILAQVYYGVHVNEQSDLRNVPGGTLYWRAKQPAAKFPREVIETITTIANNEACVALVRPESVHESRKKPTPPAPGPA